MQPVLKLPVVCGDALKRYQDAALERIHRADDRARASLGKPRLGEVEPILAWLDGAMDEGVPFALLQRIHFNLNEAKADLPRLTCETRRELRGE